MGRLVLIFDRWKFVILGSWVAATIWVLQGGYASTFLRTTRIDFRIPKDSLFTKAFAEYEATFPLHLAHFEIPLLVLLRSTADDSDLTRSVEAKAFAGALTRGAQPAGSCFTGGHSLIRRVDSFFSGGEFGPSTGGPSSGGIGGIGGTGGSSLNLSVDGSSFADIDGSDGGGAVPSESKSQKSSSSSQVDPARYVSADRRLLVLVFRQCHYRGSDIQRDVGRLYKQVTGLVEATRADFERRLAQGTRLNATTLEWENAARVSEGYHDGGVSAGYHDGDSAGDRHSERARGSSTRKARGDFSSSSESAGGVASESSGSADSSGSTASPESGSQSLGSSVKRALASVYDRLFAAAEADSTGAPGQNGGLPFVVEVVENNQLLLETQDAAVSSVAAGDICTVPLALLVLVGSVGPSAFLVLLFIPLGIVFGFSALLPVARETAFMSFVPSILVSVCVAMTCDYTLFLLARFEEEWSARLAQGPGKRGLQTQSLAVGGGDHGAGDSLALLPGAEPVASPGSGFCAGGLASPVYPSSSVCSSILAERLLVGDPPGYSEPPASNFSSEELEARRLPFSPFPHGRIVDAHTRGARASTFFSRLARSLVEEARLEARMRRGLDEFYSGDQNQLRTAVIFPAVDRVLEHAAWSCLTSAVVLACAFFTLCLADVGLMQTIGVGGGVCILVSCAVVLTIIPSILLVLGSMSSTTSTPADSGSNVELAVPLRLRVLFFVMNRRVVKRKVVVYSSLFVLWVLWLLLRFFSLVGGFCVQKLGLWQLVGRVPGLVRAGGWVAAASRAISSRISGRLASRSGVDHPVELRDLGAEGTSSENGFGGGQGGARNVSGGWWHHWCGVEFSWQRNDPRRCE